MADPQISLTAHWDGDALFAFLPASARPGPTDPTQWSTPTGTAPTIERNTMSTVDTTSIDHVLDKLAADVDVPVITGLPVAQGDLIVIPADGQVPDATTAIPPVGVPLLRGQGGHVHLLLGRVLWAPGGEGAQTLGTVTVPPGEVGYLAHGDGTPISALSRDAEHGVAAFGPGTYVIRRQREQADVIELVAD